MYNLQLCQFVKLFISKSSRKLEQIKDLLINLPDAIPKLGVGLKSGLDLEMLTATEKE